MIAGERHDQLRQGVIEWVNEELRLHRSFVSVALFGMHVASGSPFLSTLRSQMRARICIAEFVGVRRPAELSNLRRAQIAFKVRTEHNENFNFLEHVSDMHMCINRPSGRP